MYDYSNFDADFVHSRVAEFRGQVERRLDGSLTEDEFKPLRLMNGLYLQLHAYMLRIAVPYGTLKSRQMRQLAYIADTWDKGYGHFTTRQNIQFNWPKLKDVPDILEALADVEMHAIQTSGNCIRNVTADHFAGAAADEIEDPRPTAELIRQWSTDHPEFAYLPRKFKVAVTGSPNDRAVTKAHDIGLRMVRNEAGEPGYEVVIGGGLGRTPMIGKVVRDFLPKADLLAYLEAILQVYNLSGRRDNKYKARIKILVHETGLEELREQIEANFERQSRLLPDVDPAIVARIEASFAEPEWDTREAPAPVLEAGLKSFVDTNVTAHKQPNYAIVSVSIKPIGGTPGDATSAQMRALADLAEKYSHDELRISHEQNVILPHVHRADIPAVYAALREAGLATANIGLVSDIIACPGMDYCALATARSIPIAQQISEVFSDLDAQRDIGPLKIKISGCINACGHHHVGHIGILGLDRAGVENYQITLGGDGTETATIGERTGHGFAYDEIVPAVERLIETYLEIRETAEETFLQTYRRTGADPFKTALYGEENKANAA
ncbi:nitrite/sulfite reductase [Algicella marina]|uniref:Nitrite/sulfite reductase n=1 Tax=Algicella marina TaxID=2683284 RepID=A0A6P1T0Y3_9RHOB|nr:nitrite/sulfite reductase [Algicella marina]QHQ36398.1 nitrite/sulfite reductase [Algicella marina]